MSGSRPNQLKRIGRACFNIGEYEKSLEYFDRALELDPKDMAVLEYKGLAHLQMGGFEEAERTFDEILKIEPKSPYGLKGKELVRKGREQGIESVSLFPKK